MKNKFEENERRQSLFVRVKRTDLELALQFLLDPLSDVSKGDLPVPEHGTHVKVQPGRQLETVPEEAPKCRNEAPTSDKHCFMLIKERLQNSTRSCL